MTGKHRDIPEGAVQCMKCHSINSFTCHYGEGLKAIFTYTGLSHDSQAIYTITHTTSTWSKGKKPKLVHCSKCNTKIPLWMIEMNRYVRFTHSS